MTIKDAETIVGKLGVENKENTRRSVCDMETRGWQKREQIWYIEPPCPHLNQLHLSP